MSFEVFSDISNACSRNQINENPVCYIVIIAASPDREKKWKCNLSPMFSCSHFKLNANTKRNH